MPPITSKMMIFVWVFVGWVVLAGGIAMSGWTPPSPPDWLKAWTALVATVVTAAVATTALWVVPQALREFVIRSSLSNRG